MFNNQELKLIKKYYISSENKKEHRFDNYLPLRDLNKKIEEFLSIEDEQTRISHYLDYDEESCYSSFVIVVVTPRSEEDIRKELTKRIKDEEECRIRLEKRKQSTQEKEYKEFLRLQKKFKKINKETDATNS